jgi:peptidoglycan L-alanyl-D-glutamate endopeptidase CwlK
MGFKLSDRSISRLDGVHSELRAIVTDAAARCPFSFIVTEGVRTKERQAELYAQGRTKPGKKVTWSMDSRHLRSGPDSTGKAVDLCPCDAKGNPLWEDRAKFLALGKLMFSIAAERGIRIRWGYDWDGDGITMEAGEYDGPHFELVRAVYP